MDLLREIQRVASDHKLRYNTKSSITKYMLALDTIKEINEQIIQSNDLHMLMNLILYSLSGQFAVPNAFIILYNHDEPGNEPVYLGLGDLEYNVELDIPDIAAKLSLLPLETHMPLRISDLEQTEDVNDILQTLLVNKVDLLFPMMSKASDYGIIGLGKNVYGKAISEEDNILLAAILDGIAPIMSMRNSEFFDVFHSSSQAVIILSHDLIVKKMNKTAMALINCSTNNESRDDSLCGQYLSDIFPPSIFPGWEKSIRNMSPGSNVSHIRNLELNQNSLTLFYEAFITKLNGRSNKYSIMLTLEDATEKRAIGRRLAQMQSEAEKGQMLSSVAHELNNYMGVLMGGLELASHAANAGEFRKVCERIENLETTCSLVVQFASELVGKKRYKSQKSMSSLNSVVESCVKFAKLQNRFDGIDLLQDLANELPLVLIDESEIEQFLLNIINNAADAINAIKECGIVHIRTSFSENQVYLEVADNGPGIPPELKDKLFTENLTTKVNGHGFGLTVTANILKNHNAQYHISSELGKGSIFKFSFPRTL